MELAVASLNDWVPDTTGSLTGRFTVRGVWPKLTIDGAADGKRIGLAPAEGESTSSARVREIHVVAKVDTPLDPSGRVEINARDIEVAGFQFKSARITGSGNQAKHRATLEAHGDKLDASLAAAGGLTKTGWSGELSRLKLDAPDMPGLALRSPARVVYDAGAFSISESCFTSDENSLCLAANLQQSGALDASYRIEHLSLALANALAPEAMPGQLRGELSGAGKVRRAQDGQWFGDARIASPSARLVMLDGEAGESALGQHTFLLYENLVLEANLEGTRADVRVNAALDHGGKVAGNFNLSNLTAQAPSIRGEVTAAMPSLAPFAAFVPTVANVDGAVDAKIQVGGTIAAPELTGNIDATRLQADLGQLGIELREGEARAEAARGGGFKLAGHVKSGKGKLEFQGAMSERGVVDVRIGGQDFLAADIPAAKVIVTPDLALTGDPKGYLLKGDVDDSGGRHQPAEAAAGRGAGRVTGCGGSPRRQGGRERIAGFGVPADRRGQREARRQDCDHRLWARRHGHGAAAWCASRPVCPPRARASSRWQAGTRPMARISPSRTVACCLPERRWTTRGCPSSPCARSTTSYLPACASPARRSARWSP